MTHLSRFGESSRVMGHPQVTRQTRLPFFFFFFLYIYILKKKKEKKEMGLDLLI
jgi:hypothetical protein